MPTITLTPHHAADDPTEQRAMLLDESRDSTDLYGFAVRAALVTERASKQSLTELVKGTAALDPSVFDEASSAPYFFNVLASNDQVDAYFTRMAESTLRNYAADAADGVAFQNSHNVRTLPLGRSLTGTYIGAGGDGVQKFTADFYTLPGLSGSGVSSDEFVRGLRSGIYRDVSVGFYGGWYRCGLCGKNMLRWRDGCTHLPGQEYERKDPKTGETVKDASGNPIKDTAVAWIENARLAEVSIVYDGACPGAMVKKAYRLLEAGQLPAAAARLVETRCRALVPGLRLVRPAVHPVAKPAAAAPAQPSIEAAWRAALEQKTVLVDGV